MPIGNLPAGTTSTSNTNVNNNEDLPNKEDVLFLQKQLNEYLAQSLEKNATLRDGLFNDEQREEARQLVLQSMRKWTESIWQKAGPSMSINGFTFEDAMKEKDRVEPLNEGLKNEVQDLRNEVDELLLSSAAKRRTVPNQLEKLASDSVWRESMASEITREIRGILPYIDDRVNGEFESALSLAQKIKVSIPETTAKIQRLAGTLQSTKEHIKKSAVEDREVRDILLGSSLATGNYASEDSQQLAHKAALLAISSDN
ncbi:hypothetical protein BX661DRAFT_180123 [Kickxella alabastrina]|uniref:uncharacterized protein n=1 Tax=Kickxella alabastrina TaxID=61397 RepID=UPI0022206EA5|nr:uncharacterized protein BX661DRAFT_180123 [Kickxella alabastrina]KAI7830807.1 hypothetical protein BX661DRAFT_180123 [Kickxella alabastrina]